MSFTESEVVTTLTVFVILGLLATAYELWRQGKDLGWLYDENVALKARVAHLESRVADVIDWAWESSDEERPEPEPGGDAQTAPVEVAPPTQPSHPADTYSRKAWLSRRSYHGTHHADSGGVPASEFYKNKETT